MFLHLLKLVWNRKRAKPIPNEFGTAPGIELRVEPSPSAPCTVFALPGVPAERTARYTPHAGKANLILGLRPEHITETRPHVEPNQHDFQIPIDVVEPMGMETLVYFTIAGCEVCGRVNPNAGATAEKPMKLMADLSNMHLIDDGTGKVL